ncbi:MAG: TrkH family potassium uptake protein [Actinomycetota bacterium]
MSAAAFAPPRHGRLRVDLRATLSLVGLIVKWLSLALLAPVVVALIYGDSLMPFLVPLAIGIVAGFAVERLAGRRANDVGVREAFAGVALTWLAAALIGAAPYMLDGGDISAFVDAYFEAMSGFTTTGASVMADITSHSEAILFWRSLTQWLGGMGIIVLAIAVLNQSGPGGKALLQQEAPGPEAEKLTPRLRDTAIRLWLVYVGLSVALAAALWIVGLVDPGQGMNLYNAIAHTFTTMSTGGFSPEPRSMETFGWVSQLIVAVFMVLAGANFALWYRTSRGDLRVAPRDGEFRGYIAILVVLSALVGVALLATTEAGVLGAFGQAAFQVISLMTTTGFASQDFAVWTAFALLILFAAMFIGGCAGSTSGAIKVIRIRLALGSARRDVETAVHPEAVLPVRQNGRPVREAALQGATAFIGLYLVTFAVGAAAILLIATLHGFELGAFDAMVAAATTIGNVGPGVGEAGPMGSFAAYPWEAKAVMTFLMWIGRLELIPILVLATRAYWLR